MSSNAPFGRLLTAMATAFREDGSLDLDGTARIAAHLVENGNDGLVVSGTTGESPTTSVAESGEILRAVRDAVGDAVPLIAGVGTNSTAHSVELAKVAAAAGADGLLLVTPYYNKPGPAGLRHHFGTVAETTDVPVMLYDVPARAASTIDLATYASMRRYDHVTCVKDATGLLPRCAQLVDMGYSVYSGDDVTTLGYLAYGGVGLVSVVAHAAGNQLAAMLDAWNRCDHAEALRVHTSLAPAFDAMMGVPNYGATTAKAALELLGVLDNRRVRGPLVALEDDEVAALRAGLVAAGLI